MIRTAFVTLLALAGLLAFAAFYLVRETGDAAATNTPAAQTPPPETPPSDPLYYLSDIDLSSGEIALVFFDESTAEAIGILRDAEILAAAKFEASLPQVSTDDFRGSGFRLLPTAAALVDTYAQIYRDDLLIASIECQGDACYWFDGGPDVNDQNLRAAAQPLSRVDDSFYAHDDYLATIDAITRDPDYMFLHGRRRSEAFPVDRIVATLRLGLPTVITPASAPLDTAAHDALVRAALAEVLPDDATVTAVTITNLGTGVVRDTDSGSPVLAGGAPIPYPDAHFYSVIADIEGFSYLDPTASDQLINQTLRQFDYSADLAAFTRDTLQSTCTDCFDILVEGATGNWVRMIDITPEVYGLTYFDLRDTP